MPECEKPAYWYLRMKHRARLPRIDRARYAYVVACMLNSKVNGDRGEYVALARQHLIPSLVSIPRGYRLDRVLRPARQSFRTASPRRRVHGPKSECCPMWEGSSPSILTSLKTESIGTAGKIPTMRIFASRWAGGPNHDRASTSDGR